MATLSTEPMQLAQARRCGAKTRGARGGRPCRAPAMPNGKCRMHGGRSGGPTGSRNGAYKRGKYSRETKELGAIFRELGAPARRWSPSPCAATGSTAKSRSGSGAAVMSGRRSARPTSSRNEPQGHDSGGPSPSAKASASSRNRAPYEARRARPDGARSAPSAYDGCPPRCRHRGEDRRRQNYHRLNRAGRRHQHEGTI